MYLTGNCVYNVYISTTGVVLDIDGLYHPYHHHHHDLHRHHHHHHHTAAAISFRADFCDSDYCIVSIAMLLPSVVISVQ